MLKGLLSNSLRILPFKMDNIFKKASGAYDLELVSRLDLSAKACKEKGLDLLYKLNGIEECNSLIELDLTNQNIDDLRPLSKLEKLTNS